jgi:hypothetical protein
MGARTTRALLVPIMLLALCISVVRDNRAYGQDFVAQMLGGLPDRSLIQGTTAFIFTGNARCSGTLVGSRTVLTAGHCTTDIPALNGYKVVVAGSHFGVTRITTHPLYNENDRPLDSAPYDLGVVELDSAASIAPMPIFVSRPLTPGTPLILRGYGTHESSSEAGEIEDLGRVGRSVVDEVSDDGIFFGHFEVGFASTCPGDSGGPAILRESGYNGLVGTLSVGVNQVVDDNCVLYRDGTFGHVNLQSDTSQRFLSQFPDIQYISGHRIFIEAACKSSASELRRAARSSSISTLKNGAKNALATIRKARDYADGARLELLNRAIVDLRAAARSKRSSTSKSKIRSAIARLNEVRALGIY